jgi:hypothetical protein
VPKELWLTVWWLTAFATAAAIVVFAVHWWRSRRRPRPHGASFYLDKDLVMDLYQVRYKEALQQEIEDRVVRTNDLEIRAQVYGAEAGGARGFNREVLRRYVQTFEPITVIGTIIDALEATDGVVHVHLGRRRVEQNRALAVALDDSDALARNRIRLRDLDVYVSVTGRFRQSGKDDATTVFLAPYGDPADPEDGPQVRVECANDGLRGPEPTGTFQARCLGTVLDWDAQRRHLVVRPIAIFH